MNKDNIILGSGNLYVAQYDVDTGIPADATLETDANTVGRIQGGAVLDYKPTVYDVKDDTNYVVKRFIISEEVSFKSGILTWDMANLERLACACERIDDISNHKTTIKLGGRGRNGLTSYVVRFVHKDSEKELRITLVGTTTNGFNLAFNPEKETVVDAEFSAISSDDKGTLVIVEETTVSNT